jgi:hypothetical protein
MSKESKGRATGACADGLRGDAEEKIAPARHLLVMLRLISTLGGGTVAVYFTSWSPREHEFTTDALTAAGFAARPDPGKTGTDYL